MLKPMPLKFIGRVIIENVEEDRIRFKHISAGNTLEIKEKSAIDLLNNNRITIDNMKIIDSRLVEYYDNNLETKITI